MYSQAKASSVSRAASGTDLEMTDNEPTAHDIWEIPKIESKLHLSVSQKI
jgi:hypothetical protein